MADSKQIRDPRTGKAITPKRYLARVENRSHPDPWVYGHFDCALWEGGPCENEVWANERERRHDAHECECDDDLETPCRG